MSGSLIPHAVTSALDNTAESSSAVEWCFWCSVSVCVCVWVCGCGCVCVCVVGMFWMVSCKCAKSSVKVYSVCIRERETAVSKSKIWACQPKSLRRGAFSCKVLCVRVWFCVCLNTQLSDLFRKHFTLYLRYAFCQHPSLFYTHWCNHVTLDTSISQMHSSNILKTRDGKQQPRFVNTNK